MRLYILKELFIKCVKIFLYGIPGYIIQTKLLLHEQSDNGEIYCSIRLQHSSPIFIALM